MGGRIAIAPFILNLEVFGSEWLGSCLSLFNTVTPCTEYCEGLGASLDDMEKKKLLPCLESGNDAKFSIAWSAVTLLIALSSQE